MQLRLRCPKSSRDELAATRKSRRMAGQLVATCPSCGRDLALVIEGPGPMLLAPAEGHKLADRAMYL